jgi:hypothetical protein
MSCLLRRHFSEQYLTSPQTRSHFLRQLNGRLQTMHSFDGRFAFFMSSFLVMSAKTAFMRYQTMSPCSKDLKKRRVSSLTAATLSSSMRSRFRYTIDSL